MVEIDGRPNAGTDHDDRFVLEFEEIDRDRVPEVGGKGANLAELSRIAGIEVPAGFCVTAHAFREATRQAPALGAALERLGLLDPGDRAGIAELSAEVRALVEGLPVPDEIADATRRALARQDEGVAYAVRSSASAEDQPTSSFAGQHDTYLDVVGLAAILEHVKLCWGSLFTERAVTYRLRRGLDQRTARMAVVVQQMVVPHASGVLFTADPVTSNRMVCRVEAVLGLGEALVSGRANADSFTVRAGVLVDATIATKEWALRPTSGGGTRTLPVAPELRAQPSLDEAEVVHLAGLGRLLEAHFGGPQDIEWCLSDGGFRIVQSRPITTLFPVPEAGDRAAHVYVSVGHQQMMTDAMTPLGLSVWQMTTPRPMAEAGSRLFVDVTSPLASPTTRSGLLEVMGRGDPLVRDALETVLDRGFLDAAAPSGAPAAPPPVTTPAWLDAGPELVDELIAENRASLATASRDIARYRGVDLIDFIVEDFDELRRLLFDPRSHRVFTTAMDASFWLDEHMHAWLGEEKVADTLTRSAPNNVTSEMGLALLDVADVIRPHPQVVTFLHDAAEDDDVLDGLLGIEGGRAAFEAIRGFLADYGMRCAGEIDIASPRWSERPATLLPVLLGHVENAEPGAGRRRFEQGRAEAHAKEEDLLARLRALPAGEETAAETETMIRRLRTFIGHREYPKFSMISRYFIYKQALLAEADELVHGGVLRERDDIFFLRFDELRDVLRKQEVDDALLRERRHTFAEHRALTPPRVLTSDGEAVNGTYHRADLPPDVLIGLPVSRGVAEGRARVVLDMASADLSADDILVTRFTDPSWSPVFVTIRGLVTEVGGTMTHGAVVAREYGLPAVVGVQDATRSIRDGQRIRVDGASGLIELLTESAPE